MAPLLHRAAIKSIGNGMCESRPMIMQLVLQATAHGATTCSVHSSCPLGTLDTFASALYTD